MPPDPILHVVVTKPLSLAVANPPIDSRICHEKFINDWLNKGENFLKVEFVE